MTMKTKFLRARRGAAVALAVAAVSFGAVDSGVALEDVLPGSCKTHPTKVVNPACDDELVKALAGDIIKPGFTYPNLVPNVTLAMVNRAWIWNEDTQTFSRGAPELWFDTWAQNFGTVPLDVMPDDPDNPATTAVTQCVSWTAEYVCRQRQASGGFSWHEEHTHFHFNDFAAYALRHVNADGSVDYSDAGLVGISDKVSFCLMDSRRVKVDSTSVPTYHTCSNRRQGITPGWTDIYGASLPGQNFPLTGVADGRYAIVVDMNTSGTVRESDLTDNRVEAIIDVTVGTDTATIVETRWP